MRLGALRGWGLAGVFVIGLGACVSSGRVEPSPTTPAPASSGDDSLERCDVALDDPCVAWRVDEVQSAVVGGGLAVAVHVDGRVVAYDATSGAARWDEGFPGEVSVRAVRGGRVYLQSPTEVFVVSATDGTELWRRAGSLLDLADTDGIVLVHTGPGVDAVAVEGGETVWSATVADRLIFVFGGLGDSGRVILADSDTSLVEYDRTTGEQLWRYQTSPGIAAVTSTLAAVRHTADRYLVLDNGGNALAEHDMDAGGWLATIDDQLVELRFAGGLRGIDADTGAYAWELPNAIPAQSFGDLYSGASRLPPALVAGTNIDGVEVVAMIDPGTGQPRWQMRANTDLRAAVAGDVYVVLIRPTGVTTWHDKPTGRTAATVIIRNPQILSDDPAVVLSDNSLIGLELAG